MERERWEVNRSKTGAEVEGTVQSGTGSSPLKHIGHSDAYGWRLDGRAAKIRASP